MNMFKRIICIIVGTILLGAGMGAYIKVGIGSDAFSAFLDGFNSLTGISQGTINILINSCYLICAFLLDKKKIGIATFICMLGCKIPIDFTIAHFPEINNVFVACIVDVGLCAVFGIACALVAKGGLGTTAYDAFTLSITKKTNAKYEIVRYICDGAMLVAAILSGGLKVAGLGTIIAVAVSGPFFNFFLKLFKAN